MSIIESLVQPWRLKKYNYSFTKNLPNHIPYIILESKEVVIVNWTKVNKNSTKK